MKQYVEQMLGLRNKVVSLVSQGKPKGLKSTYFYIGQIGELFQDLRVVNQEVSENINLNDVEKNEIKKSILHLFQGLNEFATALIYFMIVYKSKINEHQRTIDQAFNRMVAYGIAQEINDDAVRNYVMSTTQQYRIDHGVASEGIKKITLS